MLGLAQRSFELRGVNADEPVVGGVLDVDQLTQLASSLLAAGSDLFEQRLGVVMIVGRDRPPSS